MKKMTIRSTATAARNEGIRKEWALTLALTGVQPERHDNVAFDAGSDIEELNLSVKSSHATLAARLDGDTKEAQIADYFSRTASTAWAYVTNDYTAYIMNADEFNEFLNRFSGMDTASKKNGGGKVVRILRESKKMLQWFEERA